MRTTRQELTLSSALSDPLIGALMAADKVDPVRFEAMLRTVAREIGAGSQPKKPLREITPCSVFGLWGCS